MNPVPAAVLDPLLATAPLLDPVPAEGDVTPGWLALALIVGLFVVTALLWMSMRKQLGKIRFREEPDASEDPASPDSASSEARRENGAGSA